MPTLHETRIRAAKPAERPYKLFDERGLFLLVTPAGGRLWRLRYRMAGVEKLLTLGAYPDVPLKRAREKRDEARKLFPIREKHRKFADLLNRTFALRDELKRLAAPETIVCRCEDVTFERLRVHESWRAAKLQTRCGMGPCQGRVCGAAVEFLFGWRAESVRPPALPVRVESLIRNNS